MPSSLNSCEGKQLARPSFIGGGQQNRIYGNSGSVIVGGSQNKSRIFNPLGTNLGRNICATPNIGKDQCGQSVTGDWVYLGTSDGCPIMTAHDVIVGGCGNQSHGAFSSMTGGCFNSTRAAFTSINGGLQNTVGGIHCGRLSETLCTSTERYPGDSGRYSVVGGLSLIHI